MSPTNSARCTACDSGELTPTKLTVTLIYDGQSHTIDDDDALLCSACGDELIGERAAASLLTQRALAPHAEMTATVSRLSEIV
jgi:YgiT-type zinc finger domain-containing protein